MVMPSNLPQGVRLNPRNTFEVCEGMSIQAAINAAAAQVPAPSATNPWNILIYPGIYIELITMSSWVNLKGIGPKGSVVIVEDDAVIILANNVEIADLTVRMDAPTSDGRAMMLDSLVACTAKFTNLVFEITTPGAWVLRVLLVTGASSYTFERCSCNIGGTGASFLVRNTTNAATFRFIDNDFTQNNPNAFHFSSNQPGSTWTGKGNRWAGTCGMFSAVGGTLTFDNDAIICTGAWTNTGSTMTLRHCAIEAPVVAGNGALVRLKNCSYRAIQRAGTGNIVDESPWLGDAPWKVHKWNWMTALANMDVGVRGTPVDAGSGQVLLEVNTGAAADQEAVETNPEAAGSLGNELTPARTPRFITQIAVDNFHADADMFFGLRETLGNAIPNIAAEECAGFDWNGANFRAISSDGGGVGQTTNLTTPSVNVQHQLEVIVLGGVQVEFYVDGVLVATHATAGGRPSAALDWQHLLNNGAGGGAAADIDVTIRPGGAQECPA